MTKRLAMLAVCTLACVGCKPTEDQKINARMTVLATPAAERQQLDAALANQIILDAQAGKPEEHAGKVLQFEGVVHDTHSRVWNPEDDRNYESDAAAKAAIEEADPRDLQHVNEVDLVIPDYAALEITCIFDKDYAPFVQSLEVGQRLRITGSVRKAGKYSLQLVGCVPSEEVE